VACIPKYVEGIWAWVDTAIVTDIAKANSKCSNLEFLPEAFGTKTPAGKIVRVY
jgi:hypothetical protein